MELILIAKIFHFELNYKHKLNCFEIEMESEQNQNEIGTGSLELVWN
jgi:hypothetical protein